MGHRAPRFLFVVGVWLLILKCAACLDASICESSLDGSGYQITNQADADAIRNCTTFTGNLFFNITTNVTNVFLNGVQQVTGQVEFSRGARLDTFVAPDLAFIGSMLTIFMNGGRNMTFSSLTTIGGLEVYDDGTIHVLSFPKGLRNWASAPGPVSISGTNLTSMTDIQFSEISGLLLEGNLLLQNFASQVETISESDEGRSISVLGNAESSSTCKVNMPNLTKLSGIGYIQSLTDLSMSKLASVNGSLYLSGLELSSLDLSAFTNVGSTTDDSYSILSIEDSYLDSVLLPAVIASPQLVFKGNNGTLYETLTVPNLVRSTYVSVEQGSNNVSNLNCSYWNGVLCQGTIDTLYCLDEAKNRFTACKGGGMGASQQFSTTHLLFGLLISFGGAAAINGFM